MPRRLDPVPLESWPKVLIGTGYVRGISRQEEVGHRLVVICARRGVGE